MSRFVFVTIIVLLLVSVATFLVYRSRTAGQAAATGPGVEPISAGDLEERYGVRLRLLAVTAGGGMVDLRLKILDAEKATPLLGEPSKPPLLVAEDSGTTLQAPEGSMGEEIRLQDGQVLILLYPNAGGAIRPGTPVSVVFGNERLEPVLAQ